MATLLVGYDLNAPNKDYGPLIDAIKALGAWWHHLDSTWLVVCSSSAADVRDMLKAYIDSDDELLVIDVTGRGRAWRGFNDRGSTWLAETYE